MNHPTSSKQRQQQQQRSTSQWILLFLFLFLIPTHDAFSTIVSTTQGGEKKKANRYHNIRLRNDVPQGPLFATGDGGGDGNDGATGTATPTTNKNDDNTHNDNSNNDHEKYQRFYDWLFDEKGCEGRDSVQILFPTTPDTTADVDDKNGQNDRNDNPQRRGLFAKKEHKRGDVLVSVPFSTALTIETIETTDAERGQKFIEMQWQQQQYHSLIQPYMDVLPTRKQEEEQQQHWDPTPDFWTDEQIQQLEFPRLVQSVLDRKRRMEQQYQHLLRTTDQEKKGNHQNNNQTSITREELQFATWIVESRSLTLIKASPLASSPMYDDNVVVPDDADVDDDNDLLQTTSIMIPLIDMINHSSDDPNAEIQVIENDDDDDDDDDEQPPQENVYAVVASRDIATNDEITISYGTGEESSIELLQYYGFVPSYNSYDVDMLNDALFDDEEDEDRLLEEAQWTTTLEEDEAQLLDLMSSTSINHDDNNNHNNAPKTILEFRIRLKRAIREWESLEDEDDDSDDDDEED